MVHNRLKRILREGKTAIGTFVESKSADMVEIIGISGFDFVIIDCEHGPMTVESTLDMIRAAESKNVTPIVRVPNAFDDTILHTLDVGAHGIQVPQVNDMETAHSIVVNSKYFPIGDRGVAFPRSADYGFTDLEHYFADANEETMVVAQCENKACLDILEDICKIPEIDVIFLGPYDMSQSLGVTGQVTHKLVEDAAKKVVDTCNRYGKAAGILVADGKSAKMREEQGFRYIVISLDLTMFGNKCKEEIKSFYESDDSK